MEGARTGRSRILPPHPAVGALSRLWPSGPSCRSGGSVRDLGRAVYPGDKVAKAALARSDDPGDRCLGMVHHRARGLLAVRLDRLKAGPSEDDGARASLSAPQILTASRSPRGHQDSAILRGAFDLYLSPKVRTRV